MSIKEKINQIIPKKTMLIRYLPFFVWLILIFVGIQAGLADPELPPPPPPGH